MPVATPPANVVADQWSTKYVDDLPDSSFAWIDNNGGRHLPYKASDGKVDLPHVRNALARLNQVQGMSDTDKTSVRSKLQGALKNVKASDDMVLRSMHSIQSDDNLTQDGLPTRVMLLRSGNFNTQKYGEVPLAASDLREMDANFKAGIGMADDGRTGIPVDYAHQSHLNAAFWIKATEVEEQTDGAILWGTNLEFSASGKQALLGKEYKCLSSDFYPKAFGEWVDPESGVSAQNVIVGAALTNRPMFSGNQTVLASETDDTEGGTKTVIYINATENKETKMNLDQLRVKAADEVSGPEQRFLQAHAAELSADEQKKFEVVAPVEAATAPKVIKASEVTGEEGQVVVQASELKSLVEKVSTVEASLQSNEKAQLRDKVLAHAKRGAIKADRIDSWTNRLAASDEKGREEILADLTALADNPVLAAAQGNSDGDEGDSTDPRAEMMAAATEIVTKSGGKTDIRAALEQVQTEKPELALRAAAQRKEQLSGMQASDDQFAAAGINRG